MAAVAGRRAAGPPKPGRRLPGSRSRRKEAATAYLFIAPNLAVFVTFMFVPLAWTFVYATQHKLTFGPSRYVGLDNFRTLYHDPTFWRSLLNTVGYAAVSVPLELGLGLGVALLLNGRLPLRGMFRTIFFVPVVISGLSSGIIVSWIFNEEVGVANKIAGYLGSGPLHWQSNPKLAIVTVVLVTLWVSIGFNMVVFLAALQGVPREYYDAASVDGATHWSRFRHVTLPGIRYSTVFLAVYGVITSFQVFDLVYSVTGGGPGDATNVLGLYAYQSAFETRDTGYGAAIGVVLYLLIMSIIALQFTIVRLRRRRTG
jgi:multiple sugar transport system permease protein